MLKLQIRDVVTGKVFDVSPIEDRVTIVTGDGVKVKLYPVTIKTMVRKGHKFEGHTVTGKRLLERVK